MVPLRRLILMCLTALIVSSLLPRPAHAGFNVTVSGVSRLKGVELKKVTIVTAECFESMDCTMLERRAVAEAVRLKLDFKLVSASLVRDLLLKNGHTEYTPEMRELVGRELEVDAIFELKGLFGKRGDGPWGQKGSEARVELLAVRPNGDILFNGIGTGRPSNVVSSPEMVAGTLVELILKKAFK